MNYRDFVQRKLQTIAPAGLEPPFALPESLFPMQRDLVSWALRRGRAAIFADTGLGKAQPVSEPVLTPTGWRPIGDIKHGDFVIGSDGQPTQVIGVYPQGQQAVFRVELSDGTFTRCNADHLWNVRTKVQKYRGQGFVTMTAKEIAESIHREWQLPIVDPVTYSKAQILPVDPYTLGVMLGDGHLRRVGMSVTTDDEIGESLGWRKSSDHDSPGISVWAVPLNVRDEVVSLGLSDTKSASKFVPAQYLLAAPQDRLSLLQGLMDTDGYAMPDGGAEFSTTSECLMQSVRELAQSLGGIARGLRKVSPAFTHNGEKRIGQDAYRVNVKLPGGMPMFRLSRKAAAYKTPTKYHPARIIRAVVDEGVAEEQVCIKVAARDELYVTRDYIVTHNTRMEIAFADEVCRRTGGDVMILAPLAVAQQTVNEAAKMGITVTLCREQSDVRPGINITNYDRLHKFDMRRFIGVVPDESSCIKHHTAKLFDQMVEACRDIPYRLCATATPAPNDWTELGTHAEFLGVCTRAEMLAEFFVHDGGETQTWRLKGHARHLFWRWVSQWGACVRRPSDLGYDDEAYRLPPLNVIDHVVGTDEDKIADNGMLFALEASTLSERREAKKASLSHRVDELAAKVNASPDIWVIWCELNAEADALKAAIPDAVEIRGPDDADTKERRLAEFAAGQIRVLITKPSITGWGLNWQHCHNTAFVGVTDSFEAYYQAVRRFWRFGQALPVNVHRFYSIIERAVVMNMTRKEAESIQMGESLAAETAAAVCAEIRGTHRQTNDYNAARQVKAPAWLRSNAA